MKILYCFSNIFWFLLFSAFIPIYPSDELVQDSSKEEFDESVYTDPDEEQAIHVLPTKPVETGEGEEVQIGLTMKLPVIGDIICYSEIDPKTGEDVLRATLPGKSINLSPVPLFFDNFEFIIPTGKNPYINATATIFGKKAKIELIEAKKESAFIKTPIKTKNGKEVDALSVNISVLRLRILFIDKPTLSFFPDKSLDLNHIDLLVEIGKLPSLATEINIFGQPVNVQFGFTKQSATIDFSLPSTQFSNIIPFIKNTPLAEANLKSITISAKYLFAKNSDKKSPPEEKATSTKDTEEELKKAAESKAIGSPASLSLAISAQADFSSIDDNLKKYINLKDLTVNGTYSQAEGFHMESVIKDFRIPIIGKVSEAKFIIDWSEKINEAEELVKEAEEKEEKLKQIEGPKANAASSEVVKDSSKKKGPQLTVSITGNGVFTIPISGLGQLKYTLSSEYINNEFVLGGNINESFSYSSIKIASEALFVANLSKKSITITGNTDLNGLDLIAKLVVAPDEKTKETVVALTASAKTSSWQPLAKLDLDLPNALKNITLTNLDAGLIAEKKAGKNLTSELVVKGQANIMNIDVDAQVHFIKNDTQTGIFIKANVPEDKLPSALEKMQIKDAIFVLSTIAYVDEDPITKAKTKYAEGLNLKGEFNFTKDLKLVGDLLHIEHLNIVGVLDPVDIRKSKFSIQLPGIINTGTDLVSFGPLSLEVTGQPSFDLVAEVTLRPDKKNELLFKGSTGIKSAAIGFELSMFGLWKNPFNLISEDFAIGNAHLGFSFIPLPPPAFVSISSFGFGGETELSKTQDIKFALKIDLQQPQNLALLGSLDGKLTLEEFVSFILCKVIKNKMELNTIPDISMEDIKVNFAPINTEIGGLKVEEGITLKGKVNLFGEEIAVDFEVKRTGAKAQANMSPINLPPLHITSGITAKGDKRETKLNGPSVDIELSTARQQFLISGMLEIDNIFAASSDIYISRSGIEFNFETYIGPRNQNLFKGKVRGYSAGPLSNPNFSLHIEMEQHFIEFMQKQITSGLNTAQKRVQDKINETIGTINSIDKQIAQAKSTIDNATNKVEEWKNKVNSLDVQITSKKKELNYYKTKISGGSIGSIWSDAKDKLNKTGRAIGNIAKGAAIVAGVYSDQAITASKNLAQKGLEKAQKEADRIVNAAKIIELGTQIAALESGKASAIIGLKGFQLVLEKIVKGLAVGTLEASKRASIGILNAVKNSTVQILKAGEWTVKSLGEGFTIKKVVFDGSLQKIKDGELLDMLFEITFLGTNHNVKFNFNFKDVKKTASNLAEYIVNKFIPKI